MGTCSGGRNGNGNGNVLGGRNGNVIARTGQRERARRCRVATPLGPATPLLAPPPPLPLRDPGSRTLGTGTERSGRTGRALGTGEERSERTGRALGTGTERSERTARALGTGEERSERAARALGTGTERSGSRTTGRDRTGIGIGIGPGRVPPRSGIGPGWVHPGIGIGIGPGWVHPGTGTGIGAGIRTGPTAGPRLQRPHRPRRPLALPLPWEHPSPPIGSAAAVATDPAPRPREASRCGAASRRERAGRLTSGEGPEVKRAPRRKRARGLPGAVVPRGGPAAAVAVRRSVPGGRGSGRDPRGQPGGGGAGRRREEEGEERGDGAEQSGARRGGPSGAAACAGGAARAGMLGGPGDARRPRRHRGCSGGLGGAPGRRSPRALRQGPAAEPQRRRRERGCPAAPSPPGRLRSAPLRSARSRSPAALPAPVSPPAPFPPVAAGIAGAQPGPGAAREHRLPQPPLCPGPGNPGRTQEH
ncbi:collagen alpha-1(I) chain-like [Passer domesticus]|uniref:collagen alpha-1(I) chain-like n=1 Tax=Passer domesticus TaxID=48849 RepID=UPI0030FE44A1